MARAALLHLLRSQSRSFVSGTHFARAVPLAHVPQAKINPYSVTTFPSFQRHWSSRAEEDNSKISIGPRGGQQHKNQQEKGDTFIYEGANSTLIKKVKMLSLSTCCLSVSLGPVITFMTNADSNVILKGAVAATIIMFSASTTGMLHWFASPYVHKLIWQPGSDSFDVVQMSWLATFLPPKTIKFSEVRYADTKRPIVTFKAYDKFYYVETDGFQNKALLAKLTPARQASEPALKNL